MTIPPENLSRLRQAFAASPDNMALLMLLVDQEMESGFLAEAEALLRQALSMGPSPWAQRKLSACFEAQNRVDEALVLTESLTTCDAPEAGDWARLARLQIRKGETKEAMASYAQAKRLDQDFSDDKLEKHLRPAAEGDADGPAGLRFAHGTPQPTPPPMPSEAAADRAATTFADVGGMEEQKRQVRLRIILPLKQPDMFAAYGRKAGGGLLLYGPPGCGKTLLARATAGEIEASFFNIGIHDILDPYHGESERKMHALFETARAHKPAVMFFDEIDALATNRRDFHSSVGRHLINQFLSEMDGLSDSNEDLLIIGATNAPWHMDPAFRRPGRFDRILFVPPPDVAAREAILDIHLRGKPTKDVDIPSLAAKAKGFSGADLREVIERAIEMKLDRALETGIPEPLRTKDLMRGLKQHAPTTGEWFASARNHATYANEGGVYDDVLRYLGMK